MWHKPCRTFHPWCPCIKTRCLFQMRDDDFTGLDVTGNFCRPASQSRDKVFKYVCPCHHDDVIKWKYFPRYWPFVRGIHRSPVNSPHKGQRRGALMFSLICVWINGGVNNREAGELRRYIAHYDVTEMLCNVKSSLERLDSHNNF